VGVVRKCRLRSGPAVSGVPAFASLHGRYAKRRIGPRTTGRSTRAIAPIPNKPRLPAELALQSEQRQPWWTNTRARGTTTSTATATVGATATRDGPRPPPPGRRPPRRAPPPRATNTAKPRRSRTPATATADPAPPNCRRPPPHEHGRRPRPPRASGTKPFLQPTPRVLDAEPTTPARTTAPPASGEEWVAGGGLRRSAGPGSQTDRLQRRRGRSAACCGGGQFRRPLRPGEPPAAPRRTATRNVRRRRATPTLGHARRRPRLHELRQQHAQARRLTGTTWDTPVAISPQGT